jgi:peptidyl-prolyl cis-trans isomerase C
MRHMCLLLATLLACGCSKSSGPRARPTETSGPVVATFGDHALTTAELQREFNDQSPFVRSHYQSMEKKKEFLESMIKTRLLADQALKDGFDKDDEVIEEQRKALIEEWTKEKFNDREGMKSIPDSALHQYYDSHLSDYQRPEELRVQIVLFASDHGGDAKAKADAIGARKALMARKDLAAFAELARERSDDAPSKLRGGDLDFHTQDDLAKSYGDDVAKAAFGLKLPDEISEVARGERGYYLVRLESRRPAFSRTFEQVELSLRTRLWNEKRAKVYQDFVKEMMDKAQVKIDDAQLARIDPNQPGALSDEPMPGMKPVEPPHLPGMPPEKLNTPLTPGPPGAPAPPSRSPTPSSVTAHP